MTVFSYQLYSSRNFPPLADTLTMVRQAGYEQVEGYGGLLDDTRKIRELANLLAQVVLQMPSAHIDLQMLEEKPELVSRAVDELELEAVFIPFIAPGDRPDNAGGWRQLGARLEKSGRFLLDRGVALGWHNHDFEFLPCPDGTFPIQALLAGGPSLVLELDLAWVKKAGQTPTAWMERLSRRIAAVHIKDIAKQGDNIDEDGWADVGHGTLPWPEIRDALATFDDRLLVIEHDNPEDHKRFAHRSIDYLKSIWGS